MITRQWVGATILAFEMVLVALLVYRSIAGSPVSEPRLVSDGDHTYVVAYAELGAVGYLIWALFLVAGAVIGLRLLFRGRSA